MRICILIKVFFTDYIFKYKTSDYQANANNYGKKSEKISHNTSKTSIQILKTYPIPKDILSAN